MGFAHKYPEKMRKEVFGINSGPIKVMGRSVFLATCKIKGDHKGREGMKTTVVLVLLSLVLILKNAQSQLAETNCKYFAKALPLRLRELRITFNKVKEYFQTQDEELDIMLIKEDLLEDFKGFLGCQSVGEMIQFYLEDVLPNVSSSNTINQNVGFLGDTLLELRQLIKRCHRYFICEKKSKTINDIKDTYKKLQDRGIYKAMGEFDTFINYIEEYLMMKIRK